MSDSLPVALETLQFVGVITLIAVWYHLLAAVFLLSVAIIEPHKRSKMVAVPFAVLAIMFIPAMEGLNSAVSGVEKRWPNRTEQVWNWLGVSNSR